MWNSTLVQKHCSPINNLVFLHKKITTLVIILNLYGIAQTLSKIQTTN
jgi:hypothetical protein